MGHLPAAGTPNPTTPPDPLVRVGSPKREFLGVPARKPPSHEPAAGHPAPRPTVTPTPDVSTTPREVPFRPPPCSHQDRDRILADGSGKAGSPPRSPVSTQARDMMLRLKGHFRGEDVELRPEDHAALRRAEANPESSFAKALELLGKPPAPAKQPPTLEEILRSVGPPPAHRAHTRPSQPAHVFGGSSKRRPTTARRTRTLPQPTATTARKPHAAADRRPLQGPRRRTGQPHGPQPGGCGHHRPHRHRPRARRARDSGPRTRGHTDHTPRRAAADRGPFQGPHRSSGQPRGPQPGGRARRPAHRRANHQGPSAGPGPTAATPRTPDARLPYKKYSSTPKAYQKSGGTRQPCKDKGEGRRETCFLNYPPRVAATKTPPRLTSRRQSTAPLHARPPDNTSRRLSARGADKPGRRSWRFVASKQRPTQQPKGHPHPPPPTPRRRRAWAPRLETRRPPTNHARPPDPVARQGGRREGALAAPPQHC
ncbi:proline-rich protein 2-like [Leguminivora glycinivorella]|uniref:proline-rich protein 2-like n=1 Tax=Leguminivora glycinivorella TaxID=1035111 RepID=UPI00200DC345|nr:proline-rich protein 2-like [Leguminivora glycinivorella]